MSMREPEPVRSLTDRVWSFAIGCLALAIVANIAWTLIRPIIGVLALAVVVAAVLRIWIGWSRSRW